MYSFFLLAIIAQQKKKIPGAGFYKSEVAKDRVASCAPLQRRKR